MRGITKRDLALLDEVDHNLAVFVRECGPNYAAKFSALQKAKAMMRAEREALQEMVALGVVREGTANFLALQTKLAAAEEKNRLVAGDNEALRRKLAAVTASPAMAVSGD